MARTVAELPPGPRLTDYVSVGVLATWVKRTEVDRALAATGRAGVRQRELPGRVVVYYVIALALYMQSSYREVLRCLLEGVAWLSGPSMRIKITGRSGISQARSRVGSPPLRMLHDSVVKPIATEGTKGAWYRGRRVVTLDGSTLDVADTAENRAAFGRPGTPRGSSGFPQIRFVSLLENGTHVLFGSQVDSCERSELSLTRDALPHLKEGMLCLADRNFFGYPLWQQARAHGAELLWRVKVGLRMPREVELPDGSYLSTIYQTEKDRRRKVNGVATRVIEYTLKGAPKQNADDTENCYRLLTTLLDPQLAPATELAALYHERWEIETAFDELKTHLRGSRIVLRSKTPDLVLQEFFGLILAHYAVRGLMHEAALKADEDPDRLSFLHSVRVIRRKTPRIAALPPSGAKKRT